MAIFNEILVGRFNRSMQKLLGIKGGPPVSSVAGEFQATIDIGEGTAVENKFLLSWGRYAAVFSVVGLAGNVASIKFRNPAGSNILTVIEKFSFSIAQGAAPVTAFNAAILSPDTGDLNNVGITKSFTAIDGRLQASGATGFPSTQLSGSSTTLSFQPTLWQNYFQAGTPYDLIINPNQEITILPNFSLVFNSGNGATAMAGHLVWRERFLEDSERS